MKNIYKINGAVINNGIISFNKKDKKFVIYLFFIALKKNENNK